KQADLMPILMPLESVGVPRALLLVANAPIQVLIEAAYRRDIHPGEPTPQYLISIRNPVAVGVNFLKAIPVGIDDALEELGHERVFGTQPAGPYGVGGEDEDLQGLPAGFIPLGKDDPTPVSPPQVAVNNVDASDAATNNDVDQEFSAGNQIAATGVEDQAEAKQDPPATGINADLDPETDVKKEVRRPLKSALKKSLSERPLKSALKDGKRPLKSAVKDRLEKRQKAVQERPKMTKPKSVRPAKGDRPLRKAVDRVRQQRQNADSGGANQSKTSTTNDDS
ncbi:hypothetical protein, partial [Micromonospora sp. WMMD736]|uniref:hypothetical protein n=1 Tax=Micromonospora sp. WMMD736 TaxID=3404112 RepID=UPI003B949341